MKTKKRKITDVFRVQKALGDLTLVDVLRNAGLRDYAQDSVVDQLTKNISEIFFDLHEFQSEQKKWSQINFPSSQGYSHLPLIGALEELGELAHAHLKSEQGIRTNEDHREAKKDAIGDIIIYLSDYCNMEGLLLHDCIKDTWNKVRQRNWTKNKINGE